MICTKLVLIKSADGQDFRKKQSKTDTFFLSLSICVSDSGAVPDVKTYTYTYVKIEAQRKEDGLYRKHRSGRVDRYEWLRRVTCLSIN